jgi:hypothetical protein
MRDFPLDSARARLTPGQRVQTPRCPQAVGIGNLREMKKGSIMSELSMHELEAQTGEVLPEREAETHPMAEPGPRSPADPIDGPAARKP